MARGKKRGGKRRSGKRRAAKSRANHKPLKLLKTFRNKMEKNIVKLDHLIERRKAAGER